MTSDGFPMFSLSSGAFPARARLEACRNFFGAPMVGLEFSPRIEDGYGVEVSFAVLPETRIGKGRFEQFRIDRTSERIATDGNADFALIIAGGGRHEAVQAGRAVEFGAGEAVLTTDAEPASVLYGRSADFIVIQPSRRALTALVPGCDDMLARPIAADCEALRLLARYAALVQQDGELRTPELRSAVAGHLLDLVALVIGTTREIEARARGRGLAGARLAAVKADIDRNLIRPDLSIGAVAARQGISPRYVARLFAGEATTFSDFVRHRRLERARRRLTDPRAAHLGIGEIAFECGFGDLSYFNRCFRARFDATPGDLRRKSREDAMQGRPSSRIAVAIDL